MKFKRSLLLNLILSILVASSLFFLHQEGVLNRIEFASLDFLFRLRGNLPFNPHIVLVEIADYDILEVGRWPWNRTWLAAITHVLKDLGAKCVYFDVILSEEGTEQEDALFETSIKESQNVFLPFVFLDPSFDIKNTLLPLERFYPNLRGTGAINIDTDIDGTVRRIPLIFPKEKDFKPHIVLSIAMDYLNLRVKEAKSDYLVLGNSKENVKVPLIDKNKMLINWTGKWQDTFKHYSFLEVLSSYKDFLDNNKPEINLNDFKDSICLVGITAVGIHDILPTPLEPEYPALGVIANSLNNLLNKDFMRVMPDWINIIFIYLLAIVPAILVFGERPLRETMLVFLIGIIYFVVNLLLFKRGIRLNLSSPLLGLFISYTLVETYNFVHTSVERKVFFNMSITDNLTDLYNMRYFNMHLESEIILDKLDSNKKFGLVMIDIDNFKYFNDTYGHQMGDLVLKVVASILKNSVRSSDIVARYGGEEMIVLLRGASLKDSLNVAEKIKKGVENCVVKGFNTDYKVTISAGVSSYRPKDTLFSIVKRADDGLYRAKKSGKNCVNSIE